MHILGRSDIAKTVHQCKVAPLRLEVQRVGAYLGSKCDHRLQLCTMYYLLEPELSGPPTMMTEWKLMMRYCLGISRNWYYFLRVPYYLNECHPQMNAMAVK